MCGICGVYDLSGQGRADLAYVRRMCDRIRHRGPDGDGFYAPSADQNVAFGMRRLSIIDLEGSDQPLYNEDRSIALVFNGEIYNYRELRRTLIEQGHALRTDGDGETIIHLYEQHGLDLFRHLRGMYAFALWDSTQARLILSVDHIGMKPLYLREQGGKLTFASEVKALLDDAAQLDLSVLDTYLSFGYMIGEQTLFDGIHRLPPGHSLIAENGTTRLIEFWRFPGYVGANPALNMPTGEAGIIDATRDLLIDSVRLHLRSDVPLGLFLSGGIDSAAVLALMAREHSAIKTFTVGYDVRTQDNELLHARRVAEHFKTDHHERIITAQDWWRGFERHIYAHDEPLANPSAISLMLLAEETVRSVKVVLTGLGGDELFGGYAGHRVIPWILRANRTWGRLLAPLEPLIAALEPHYPAFKHYRVIGALPTYLPRLRHALLARADGLRRSQSFDGLVFTDHLRHELYGAELQAAWKKAQHKEQTFAALLDRSLSAAPEDTAQALIINTWLTGNALLHTDKVTMAHSLEARVPFFDPALLEFAARIPPDLRMRRNKHVLREVMRPLLPDFALERPKQPFSTPILHWFAVDLADRIQAALLDPGACIRDLFQPAALERLLRRHFSGEAPQVEVVYRLLTLEHWAAAFLKQRGKAFGGKHTG